MLSDPNRRAIALIVTCAILAYGAAVLGVFVYDDLHSIAHNDAIQHLWRIPSFFYDAGAFSSTSAQMYRPVLLVSLSLDAALSGTAPWAFKLTDVALHAFCAVLVYRVARRLRIRYGSAVVAACLFAVHPMASEAVNLTSARSNQLMVIGLLLALYCHFAAMRGHRGALWGGALATLIACGSKETGVIIPGCLFVLEALYALRRGWDVRAICGRLAPSLGTAVTYLIARHIVLGMAAIPVLKLTGGEAVSMGHGRDLLTQLCTMMIMVPKLLAQSIVPLGQSIDPYVPYTDDLWSASVICGVVFLAIITWLGLRAPIRRPAVFLGTTIAWGCSLPWIFLPLNQPVAEHRMYGALAGLALVFAGSMGLPRLALPAVRRVVAITIVLFAGLSAAHSLEFRDPVVLWNSTLAQNPYSVRAWCSLAELQLQEAGRAISRGDTEAHDAALAQAVRFCETAVWFDPTYTPARSWVVRFRRMRGFARGGPFAAVIHAEAMVKSAPRSQFYARQLARVLIQAARLSDDRTHLEYADEFLAEYLSADNASSDTLITAAEVQRALGDPAAALRYLDRAINRGVADQLGMMRRRFHLLVEVRRFREAMGVLQLLPMFGGGEAELSSLREVLTAARAVPPK